MSDDETPRNQDGNQNGDETGGQTGGQNSGGAARRGAFNVGAFLIVFGFVWLVFDNMALGLLFGLVFAGGAEVAQRATGKKGDSPDEPPQS